MKMAGMGAQKELHINTGQTGLPAHFFSTECQLNGEEAVIPFLIDHQSAAGAVGHDQWVCFRETRCGEPIGVFSFSVRLARVVGIGGIILNYSPTSRTIKFRSSGVSFRASRIILISSSDINKGDLRNMPVWL